MCSYGDKADGEQCREATVCLLAGTCVAGKCVQKPKACEPKGQCLIAVCSEDTGCLSSPDPGAACTDDNPCTTDKCGDKGQCVGTDKGCAEPQDPCLDAACDPADGLCKSIPAPAGATITCDDGDQCTQADACAMGLCVGKPRACKDAKPCEQASCDKATGCTYTLALNQLCDDDDPCTADACDGAVGACKHATDTTAACDDGDPCTENDGCATGACAGEQKNCDDGNSCTVDTCESNAVGACTNATDTTATCDDGDACTGIGTCTNAGTCGVGPQKDCDDKLVCTRDSCDAKTGACRHDVDTQVAPLGTTKCNKDQTGHCWYDGQCVVAKCGDGVCDYGEGGSCAVDCPAGGGECQSGDAVCLANCATATCVTETKACDGDAECTALKGCATGCKDAACRAKCILAADDGAVAAYRATLICGGAKCLKNNWYGVNCEGAGPAYAQCMGACSAARCWSEQIACEADADCSKLDACLAPCADDACVAACNKGVDKQAIDLRDARVACQQLYCAQLGKQSAPGP